LLKFAISSTYKWDRGSLRGNFSYHSNERIFDSPGFFDPSIRSISEFNGNTFQADIIVDQALTDQLMLIGGVNFQRPVWEPEDADTESFTMIDPYVSFVYDYSNLNVQLGGRLNNHSLYGTNFVWNINPNYILDLGSSELKVLSSYATAFLSPSLNQLYAGDFGFLAADAGNPDLDPQESQTVEGGLEWFSNRKFQIGAVYFYRKEKNMIDFVFNSDFTIGTYVNVEGETEVDGLELNASFAFLPQLTLAGHYTYTQSLSDEVILRRVPENKFGITITAIPVEKMLVKITHLHVGEVPENSEVILDSYDLIDGYVSYTINHLSISASINNIFNADYTDRFGWTSTERNFNIGLRYSF